MECQMVDYDDNYWLFDNDFFYEEDFNRPNRFVSIVRRLFKDPVAHVESPH